MKKLPSFFLPLIGLAFLTAVSPASTNFQSGNINNAGDWDNGLPGSGNVGTIAVSGTNTTTVFGYGAGSITHLTAGAITANDGFNLISGTWNISGGKVTARYFLANGADTIINLSGGVIELSDVASTQHMGAANGGTWNVSGSAVLNGTEATVGVQTGGSVNIASDWTGSWTWGPYTGDDWKNLLTGDPNIRVDGANIDAATFGSLFVVTNDGKTLAIGAQDRPTDIQLAGSSIAATASIGSLIGVFTSTDPTPGDSFTYTLVGGSGSDHNGWFSITGDRLELDRDLSGLPGALLVRVRSSDLDGNRTEKFFEITLINDSDGDGLSDDWELAYFSDLTISTGFGNNDGDALNNLDEQDRGTNPTLSDTDGDGLNDDLENGSGIFNGPGDPGSHPLLADTDGDGIGDAEEISTANGHTTNPNMIDSDGDGFPDPLELAENTDPNDDGRFPPGLLPLRLNEILARNGSDIDDGFGKREDWIEIYNPNTSAVDLSAYYLTDDSTHLTKWSFPDISIPAGDHLLIFASGKDLVDPGGHPHSNFQLSGEGEYLALIRPNGTTIDDVLSPSFPEQFTDISYGRHPITLIPQFYEATTPGTANETSGFPGVVKDTNFTIDRGFYNAPFQLSITSATPGSTIRYTTDGSLPSQTHGTIFHSANPIDIATTTTVRAIAHKPGLLPTNIDTHSYLFVDDVISQPENPPGWPTTWGSISQGTVPGDYEMDPRVVNNSNGLGVHTVPEALLDIPSVSISMPHEDFIGAANGIYNHSTSRWERSCSIEYLHPDGTPGFQEDCKIEMHGNSSRNPYRMQKHSIRLTFSSKVGIPKLHYPLFQDSPVEEFNKLVLRACFTDSWGLASWAPTRYRPNDSMYIRDVWMKDSLGAMGQPTSHGNFVHLYVNGLYWGMHNLTERIEDAFLADHFGGEKEDWEINEDFRNPESRWNTMIGINASNAAGYKQIQEYLDLENFADYMLLHFYGDAEDWVNHNGYAAANAGSGDGRFRFFVWDQEIALDKFSWNRYNASDGVFLIFQELRDNPEFRILFADRVHKHLFNGGALSESESVARFLARCAEIDKAIVAESARWGDVQANTPYGNTPASSTNIDDDNYPPTLNNPIYFTREQHWLVERDNVTQHYIPTLHDQSDSRSIVQELRSENLYPSIDAPVFGQHGGTVPTNYQLPITASAGDIYFTLDGSDPRGSGGSINPLAGMLGGGVKVVPLIELEESGWRYLDTGVAQSDSEVVIGHAAWSVSDWKHKDFSDNSWGSGQALLGYGGISGRTINSTVAPASNPRHPTTYFRKEFQVTHASTFTELRVKIIRDDGAIVYLNGREVKRTNMEPGNQRYSDLASQNATPEGDLVSLGSYQLLPGDLLEGRNVLAVELHQSATNSSDLGLDLELVGTQTSDGNSGVTLTQTGTVRARTLFNGEWSALIEAPFIVGNPASPGDLAVTEIYYNPPGSIEDTEFIELMNIDPLNSIDLTNVSLTGITYTFPSGITLAPLARIIVVKDQAAFAAAYNTAGLHIAPGSFAPSGLNNGGEEIAVIAQDGMTDIRRFTFDDNPNWPTAPDGDGYSLVLVAPESDPHHGNPFNWRPSIARGGNPGTSDAGAPFSGNPDRDRDADGLNALLEYALGTSDSLPNPLATLRAGTALFADESGVNRSYLAITYQRNLAADDLFYEVQVTDNLSTWTILGTTYVSAIHNGDGTETVTYRTIDPITSTPRKFIRLRVHQR